MPSAVQVALGNYLGVHGRERALLSHLEASVRHGRSYLQVQTAGGGNATVCLLPCHRWNYCHDDQSCCTSPWRLPLALTTREQLQRAGVAVLHQVAWRYNRDVLWLIGSFLFESGCGEVRILRSLLTKLPGLFRMPPSIECPCALSEMSLSLSCGHPRRQAPDT